MEANIESRNAERACARNPRNNKKMAQRGQVIGRHQASKAVTVLPVSDRPAEDDSAPMDVFIVATRVYRNKDCPPCQQQSPPASSGVSGS